MKMNIDEKLKADILFVIHKINKEILLSGKSDEIMYILPVYPPHSTEPNTIDEQMIINLLEREKAITKISEDEEYIVESNSELKGAGLTLHLSVDKKMLDNYLNTLQISDIGIQTNKLTISTSGGITFITSSYAKYQCKLGTKTNAYLVLRKLASDPAKIFPIEELASVLNRAKGNSSENPSEDRRVRDSIETIKEKLHYRDNELFKVDYGLGLKCAAEIIP